MTYDSFALPENGGDGVRGGDRGEDPRRSPARTPAAMLTKALLSAGSPEGDVIFGIDNTLASRATSEDLLDPFVGSGTDDLPSDVRLDGEAGEVPVAHRPR